ncbi:gamma-2-syntrophin [Pteropus vampyrus]|uniref:Gamma-2-syntrophin n=1 Tax=Pteropus vampyrus TaxID=132908 RepID=A0A6P3RVS9_PTEVA|nr:gamma-2-syntrophin [Pteropus vampyrus]
MAVDADDEDEGTKTGAALLHNEASGNAYDIRLKLTKEVLTIQKPDVVCVSGSNPGANKSERRTSPRSFPVCPARSPRRAISPQASPPRPPSPVQLPLVSELSVRGDTCAGSNVRRSGEAGADQTGMLFVGDAVLQVNGISVENATHEEAVHLLRNAGDEVTVTVQYLQEAPSFLKLPRGSPGPPSDHGSGTSSPLFDSGLHLSGDPSHTAPSSPSSLAANEPKYEKRWLDALSVPLSMARISRYKAGTRRLRSDAFEVLALDGIRSGLLRFRSARESWDWLCAVSANVRQLTLRDMKMANKCCSPCDQVVHMGWVSERLEEAGRHLPVSPKFLAVKGPSLYVFRTPPVSTWDWVRAETTYDLCEVLFKVDKLQLAGDCWSQVDLGLSVRDLSAEDVGPHCFSITVGHGRSRSFAVELGGELAEWEAAFQRATFAEVQRSGSKTYVCSWRGETLCFIVDFALGFTCVDSKTKNVLWRFKFSQLKGSSDDGKARVKLLFQDLETKQIEMKELEFEDVTAVLHCVHSFLAAKVASVDPAFIGSQSIARKYTCSS